MKGNGEGFYPIMEKRVKSKCVQGKKEIPKDFVFPNRGERV